MAEIRIINLPTRSPVLSSDYFVFEKQTSDNYYVTSKNVLSSLNLLFKQSLEPKSSSWDSTYTTVNSLSDNWGIDLTADTNLRALSGNWESTYTTVSAFSASWGTDLTSDIDLRALSGNWESTYTTVSTISVLNTFIGVETLEPVNHRLTLGTEFLPLSCEWSNTLTGQVSSLVVKLNGKIRRIPILE